MTHHEKNIQVQQDFFGYISKVVFKMNDYCVLFGLNRKIHFEVKQSGKYFFQQ